jgi:hypothetical protein
MAESDQSLTHTAWSQYFHRGKFREWVKVGRGRIDVDAHGNKVVHVYTNAIVRGDSGYICLMPDKVNPPEPEAQPRRPQEDE